MKYACLVLRGAHASFENIQVKLQQHSQSLLFLRNIGFVVHTFLLTYHTSLLHTLFTLFSPVETLILDPSEYNTMNGWKRQCFYHIKSRELIEKAEEKLNIKYDIILNSRFDFAYVKELEEFGTFDFNKINCCLQHQCGNCDDNLFLFPRNLLDIYVNAFQTLYDGNRITHEFSKVVDKSLMNYLFDEKDFRTTTYDEHGNAVEVYNYFYLSRKHV